MKISPVKNYARPAYALKIAALLTAAASVSGCAENTGKITTAADTLPAPAYKQTVAVQDTSVAGTITTVEDTTTTANETAAAVTEETTTETETTTTAEETTTTTAALTTEEIAAATTAVTTTLAALTTAAATEVTTTYEACEVEGMLIEPEECTETELSGVVAPPEEDEYEVVELDGDVEVVEEETDPALTGYANRNIDVLSKEFSKTFITASLPEDRNVTAWIRGNGYSIQAPLNVCLQGSRESEPSSFLSFIDTNDKDTLDALQKMGAVEYRYGYYKETGFGDRTITVIFVEVSDFNGTLSKKAAEKFADELRSTGIFDYEEPELEGEPYIPEDEYEVAELDGDIAVPEDVN